MNSILHQPTAQQISQTRFAQFQDFLNNQYGVSLNAYSKLHAWSVTSREEFWKAVWEFTGVLGELNAPILSGGNHLIRDRWFPNCKLNFAENLIRPPLSRNSDTANRIALITVNENGWVRNWTRQQLEAAVARLVVYFQSIGIQSGDRIAAVLPNSAEAVIGMLATTAIGAIWSSCSPEFGDDSICDRFSQIEPRVLITTASCQYNGKALSPLSRVMNLLDRLPTVQQILCSAMTDETPYTQGDSTPALVDFDSVIASGPEEVDFELFDFNHPAFILYSSGTTGKPKCIVHGAGGTLLQHLKEHQLQSDVRPDDVMMYYTTTGWMMWNWLVSGLASSATILLYDGNPLYPNDGVLFEIADRFGVTHFGTSAKFLSAIEKRSYHPREQYACPSLRVILSTGSPLMPEGFDYVYQSIKPDVHLASISGGTDIISCFVIGSPIDPVHRGEIQFAGLGMDVQVYDDESHRIWDQPGELVCTHSFPSMPIGFWNDTDNAKYLSSYFERFENVWCHGDWAQQQSDTLGWIIHGRSDATLNPSGVRIGTAEIYQQVESFSEVAEALATALRKDGDEEIVLFVRMQPGKDLDDDLDLRIRQRIRSRLSPRHVPRWIIAVPDFPRTISGKLSEIAVRRSINNQNVPNASALGNPESLKFFSDWKLETAEN